MRTPDQSSEDQFDYFVDLKRREETGGDLTEAEIAYCMALENGFDQFTADLIYMKINQQEAGGTELTIGEEVYLEARHLRFSEEEAEGLANEASEQFAKRYRYSQENSSEDDKRLNLTDLSQEECVKLIVAFRDRFFMSPGERAFLEAEEAGLSDEADKCADLVEDN